MWSHDAVLPSQGNSGSVAPEAAKQNRPTPVVHQEEPVNENLTPPSRILRSGKRVPTGTATKVPPRTASKATRVAALSSDNLPLPQVCLALQNPAEHFTLNLAAKYLNRLLACAGHTSPDHSRSCTRESREDATAHPCCAFSSKAAVTNDESGRRLPAGCQQHRASDTHCTSCTYSDPCCNNGRTQPAAVQQPCANGHPDQRVTDDTINLSALATGHKSSLSPGSNRHVKPCCSSSHCCTA